MPTASAKLALLLQYLCEFKACTPLDWFCHRADATRDRASRSVGYAGQLLMLCASWSLHGKAMPCSRSFAHHRMRCSWQADKRLQLADWRVRPLTADMLHYARADTHFLLYVADCLRVR